MNQEEVVVFERFRDELLLQRELNLRLLKTVEGLTLQLVDLHGLLVQQSVVLRDLDDRVSILERGL